MRICLRIYKSSITLSALLFPPIALNTLNIIWNGAACCCCQALDLCKFLMSFLYYIFHTIFYFRRIQKTMHGIIIDDKPILNAIEVEEITISSYCVLSTQLIPFWNTFSKLILSTAFTCWCVPVVSSGFHMLPMAIVILWRICINQRKRLKFVLYHSKYYITSNSIFFVFFLKIHENISLNANISHLFLHKKIMLEKIMLYQMQRIFCWIYTQKRMFFMKMISWEKHGIDSV